MDDILSQIQSWIQEGNDARQDLLSRASLGLNFKQGRHWSSDEMTAMKSKGVTPITVNRCQSIVNVLSGYQKQNQRDIRAFPRKQSHDALASVYSELIKHVLDDNNALYKLNESFSKTLSCGADYVELVVENDNNAIDGKSIKMHRSSVFNTIIDPACRTHDLNDKDSASAKWIILRKRINKQYAHAKYEDKLGNDLLDVAQNSIVDSLLDLAYDDNIDSYDPYEMNHSEDIQKHTYIMYVCYWKEYIRAVRWSDKRSRAVEVIRDKAQIRKVKQLCKKYPNRFSYEDIVVEQVNKTVVCNGVVVEDIANVYGDNFDKLPVVPFYAVYDDGEIQSVLDSLIDLQKEENINRTATTKLVQKQPNQAWVVGSASPEDKAYLQKFGNMPNFVVDLSRYGGKAEAMQPAQISDSHIKLAQMASQDMKEVSNVNNQMHGYDSGREESGYAIDLKRKQGLTAAEPLMDSYDYSLTLIGRMIIDFIRYTDAYSDNEIFLIIGKTDIITDDDRAIAEEQIDIHPPQMPYIPQQPDQNTMAMLRPEDQDLIMRDYQSSALRAIPKVERFQRQADGYEKLIEWQSQINLVDRMRRDKGMYSITVLTAPDSPTVQMANLAQLERLAAMYPQMIPIEEMIMATSLNNKDGLIEAVNKNRQMLLQQMSQQPV